MILSNWAEMGRSQNQLLQQEAQAKYYGAILVSTVTVAALGILRGLKFNTPLLTLLGLYPAKYVVDLLNEAETSETLQEKREALKISEKSVSFDGRQQKNAQALQRLPRLWEYVDAKETGIDGTRFLEAQNKQKKHQAIYLWGLQPALYASGAITSFLTIAFCWRIGKHLHKGELWSGILALKMPGMSWSSWERAASSFGLSRGPRTLTGDFFLGAISSGVLTLLLYHPLYNLNDNKFQLGQESVQQQEKYIERLLTDQIKEEVQRPLSPHSNLLNRLDVWSRYVTTLDLTEVNGAAFNDIAAKLDCLKTLTLRGPLLADGQLLSALPHLKSLESLTIQNSPEVKGTFWEGVPGTVTELTFPVLETMPKRIGHGSTISYYRKVVIGQVGDEGAAYVRQKLHTEKLQVSSLTKPKEAEAWQDAVAIETACKPASCIKNFLVSS